MQFKPSVVKKGIENAFASVCDAVVTRATVNGWKDGACIVACLLINDMAYIINLGDSKVCHGFLLLA